MRRRPKPWLSSPRVCCGGSGSKEDYAKRSSRLQAGIGDRPWPPTGDVARRSNAADGSCKGQALVSEGRDADALDVVDELWRAHQGAGEDPMNNIDKERLDVAYAMVDRLYKGLKKEKVLRGKAFRRMKLVEEAIQRLEAVRLV